MKKKVQHCCTTDWVIFNDKQFHYVFQANEKTAWKIFHSVILDFKETPQRPTTVCWWVGCVNVTQD